MRTIPAYKKENGTWYCSFHYKDWDGTNRRKKKSGFRTRKEALEWEREFLAKKGGGTDMSFASLVEIYMEDCQTRLRKTTCSGKQYLFDKHVLPYFGKTAVRDITPTMIRKWQNTLLNARQENGEPYKQTYLRTINNQLTACLSYAVKFYGLPQNPAHICGTMGKDHADEMQFWTKEEFFQFMTAVKKPAARLAFEILFWTGMREGELLGLTLNDVNFEKSEIKISRTVTMLGGEREVNDPKTPAGNRTVVIPKFLLALIKDYTDRLVDYDPDDPMFYFTKSYLQHELQRGCKASGVKKIRVHDIRHSNASMLIEMGFSPLLISQRLGHENIQTTLQTYGHLYPDKQKEVARRMDEGESERYADLLSNYEKNSVS